MRVALAAGVSVAVLMAGGGWAQIPDSAGKQPAPVTIGGSPVKVKTASPIKLVELTPSTGISLMCQENTFTALELKAARALLVDGKKAPDNVLNRVAAMNVVVSDGQGGSLLLPCAVLLAARRDAPEKTLTQMVGELLARVSEVHGGDGGWVGAETQDQSIYHPEDAK